MYCFTTPITPGPISNLQLAISSFSSTSSRGRKTQSLSARFARSAYRHHLLLRSERQAWLSRVLGPRRTYLTRAREHALDALHLCPLLGEGYAILATLDFLAPQRRPSAEELRSGSFGSVLRTVRFCFRQDKWQSFGATWKKASASGSRHLIVGQFISRESSGYCG